MSDCEDNSTTTPEYIFEYSSDDENYDNNETTDSQQSCLEKQQKAVEFYEIVQQDEIPDKTFNDIDTVKNMLPDDISISNNALRLLLNKQRWDIEGICERILMDSEGFFKHNKLLTSDENKIPEISDNLKTCSICFEDSIKLIANPNCPSHFFCESCYSYQIYLKITTEGLTDSIKCMDPNCEVILEPSFTENLIQIGEKYHCEKLSSKAKQQYNRFILNSTISNNPQFKACCTPGCDQIFWIKNREKAMQLKNYQFSGVLDKVTYIRGAGYDSRELLEPEYLRLECKKCSMETCFSCGMEYHYPATCDQVQNNIKRTYF